ncbi:hypothetical protein [Gordonia sp. SCSIO 19800]|uniref:hypothetical protein n=1 Tax=Gordonia sp. SCSIO 19800 TaxID=2826926 RepID=UPI001B8319CD|nr:hypothetical protein [Gordonia sp. SCSIO 19800]MBR7191802.1 hypothetical protein [Gordonia sp. SCSIO 19800]
MSRRTRPTGPTTSRSRRPIRVAAATLGLAAAMSTLVACGAEQDLTTASSASQAGAVESGSPSAEQPATSPPVVPGRKPVSTTASSATASDDSDTTCGTIPGPDGALRVMILAGDVSCDSARTIATQYGPMITTGQQQSVAGWTCAPSQLEGVLAACQKGTSVIGFAP